MNVLLIIGITLGGWGLAALVAVIAYLLDPSPTKMDWSRGGHDF